jgi:hypothetical protein
MRFAKGFPAPGCRRLAAGLVVCLAGAAVLCGAAAAGPGSRVSQRALKAALILRLIDFVEWPESGAPGGAVRVCVVGDEPMAAALGEAAEGQAGSGRPVEVRLHTSLKNAEQCPLLFVGTYDDRLVRSFLAAQRQTPMLTVGDGNDFIAAGGIVRLRVEGGRVSIDLNLKAAEAARLRVSSRLARLATVMEPAAGGGSR